MAKINIWDFARFYQDILIHILSNKSQLLYFLSIWVSLTVPEIPRDSLPASIWAISLHPHTSHTKESSTNFAMMWAQKLIKS